MSHGNKFIVLNLVGLAFLFVCWYAGLLSAFPSLARPELYMLGCLGVYSLLGFWGVLKHNYRTVSHIANGLPILGLAFTGLGLLLAINGMKSISPDTMLLAFKQLGFSITPNVVAVYGLFYLRELVHYLSEKESV